MQKSAQIVLTVPEMDSTVDLTLYRRFAHVLSTFSAFKMRFWSIFRFSAEIHVLAANGSGELKYVQLGPKECSNLSKSARNELYGRFNPYVDGLNRFAAVFKVFKTFLA